MENLERILKDLSAHHRDKTTLMVDAINERITKSVEVYYKELTNSLAYLAKKDGAKVLKSV